jgi:3D (Asp-Asp-Asp) domain-containing protein
MHLYSRLALLLFCLGTGALSGSLPAQANGVPAPLARRSQPAWTTFNSPQQPMTPVSLWATFYHVYRTASRPQGYPLLDRAGNRLGPVLSHRDWCQAALQGTVQITDANNPLTYNFSGRGEVAQVNCAPFFKSLSAATVQKVGRVRFVAATAPYGYGTEGLSLVPYRTIAVDRSRIPVGSVVFIPAARGVTVTLPSGDRVVHDGYFFAADVGSAIQGNHIDVFMGTADRSPFSFITSRPGGRFPAYIVQNRAISQALLALHR